MMSTLQVLDGIFYDIQRQGRISFYMTSTGEEALQFGSAAGSVSAIPSIVSPSLCRFQPGENIKVAQDGLLCFDSQCFCSFESE
jgi:hypothetical protein